MATIRIVFLSKGEKVKAAMLGFFEVLIWIVVISNVLDGLADDPFKIFAYAGGFSLGTFIGGTIENKLAIGNTSIMCVIDESDPCKLVETLRSNDIAITILKGEGKDSNKKVLMMFTKRKNTKTVLDIIKKCDLSAIITTSETKPESKIYGIKK